VAQILPAWRERIAALLGVSAYQGPPTQDRSIDDPDVEAARARLHGQLTPYPYIQTRWFLSDLEGAVQAANQGDMGPAARLYRAMRGDGVFAGLLSARTGRAVRLPRRFSGDPQLVAELEGRQGARSVLEEMFPPSELEALADDGLLLGIGVAELMPVQGRDYPVLVRLDPEWLRYRWSENRWYYQSTVGQLPITPGDGRWVLHTPGGRLAPWQRGLWQSCGHAYITKSHAQLHQANWEGKLANPARAAVAPLGASDAQRAGFLQRLIAWGVNTVFELPVGWDVKLIESNGRGYESFGATIDRAEYTYAIAICGQVVTTNGGAGFSNADVPERVLTSLVNATADAIAYTLNTQGLPQWVVRRHGEDALDRMPVLELAAKEPRDMTAQAQTMVTVAAGIKALREELAQHGRELDIAELTTEYGIPIAGDADGDGNPDSGVVSTPPPPPPASGTRLVPPAPPPPDEMDPADAPPTDEAAAALAAKMTEHQIPRCEHGSANRCRLCGIERVRDFEPGEDGTPQWKIAWRPIRPAAMEAA
jgi:hypothetical protein